MPHAGRTPRSTGDPRRSHRGSDAGLAVAGDQPGHAAGREPAADGAGAREPAPTPWAVRVTAHELVAPELLIAHPDNFRCHPESQRTAVRSVIDDLGFVGEVLVSRRSGRILDGHLRVEEALRTGQAVVPVGWVDCRSDDEEAAILATHDPIGAMATADRQRLAQLAEKVQLGSDPLKALLIRLAARPATAPDPEPEPAPRAGGGGFGQGSGRLGAVGDLIHPVVVECGSEEEAEDVLALLVDDGHHAYLLPASPSSLGHDDR
jgi:hypothetical protein